MRVLSVTAYPFLLLASVAGTIAMLPIASEVWLVPGAIFVIGLIATALERWMPWEQRWRSGERVSMDILHLVISMGGATALFRALAFGALYALAAALAEGGSLWPTRWPLALQLLLALPIAELGYYGIHRLSHTLRLVWRFHAVHHSLPRLYWLNAGYFHPVDAVLNYALEVIPLILLGAPRQLLALYAVLTAVNGLLKHSNIDLRTGALSWIFSTPELHRWHHSPDPAEGNTNYGSNLVVWDVLFGTRYLPPRRPPAEIRGARVPDGYLGQLAYPLRGE